MAEPTSADIEAARQLFIRGVAAHQAGNLHDAEQAFREALKLVPDRPSVLNNLGLVLLQAQKLEEAEAVLQKKAALDPSADSLLALGDCLALRDKFDDALASYNRAAALDAGNALAHARAARALNALGRAEEALARVDQALALAPHDTFFLLSRGDVLYTLSRFEQAAACYEALLRIDPHHVQALNHGVAALAALGRHEDALAYAQRALTLAPDDGEVLRNHGNVLADLQRYPQALASLDRALQLRADDVDAHANRALVLVKLLRYEEAKASLRAALALAPDGAELLTGLARVWLLKKNPQEALAPLERVLAREPGHAKARALRGDALLALDRAGDALADFDAALVDRPGDADLLNRRCNALLALNQPQALIDGYQRLAQASPDYDYALGCLLHAKRNVCDWHDHDANVRAVRAAVRDGKRADLPFTFLAIADSAAEQLQCARLHAAHEYPSPAQPLWRREIYRHDKIRVAYLSADFHEHATAYLMAGLFESHDASRFETTAISFGPDTGDAMRGRLKRAFARFVDVRQRSDDEVAALLRELEIDIAVDLKGYTQQHRAGILAYRPAPIQVNYLGYPGTLGAPFIDYLIADAVVIPRAEREYYSEKVVYLPESYQVNDARREISPHTTSRAAHNLPDDRVVFCCFNNPYKITPQVFDVWMRLLQQVAGSVLWLLAGHAPAMRNLRNEAARRGVARERLIFAPRMPLADHLARHRLADIFLDTLPYNAHTTASDALWAGLPVVTCAGNAFAGRVAASLLTAVGMPELICDTQQAYESLALALATNRERLVQTKTKLAALRAECALFDTARFCRHLEAAYATMWQRYQNGESPAAFAVPAL